VAALGAALLAATASLLTSMGLPRSALEIEIANRPVQLSADGYVSSAECRSCHPSNYASWRASYHPA
jgi:hypothetical protein